MTSVHFLMAAKRVHSDLEKSKSEGFKVLDVLYRSYNHVVEKTFMIYLVYNPKGS